MQKHKTILYIVDPQNDFLNKNGKLYVEGSERIIEPILRAMKIARELGIEIFISMDSHTESSTEFIENGGQFPPHCLRTDWGGDLIPNIDPTGCTILNKDCINVWDSPECAKILNEIDIEYLAVNVIVCGVAGDYCVKAAAKGFAEMGWNTNLLESAIASVDEEQGMDWARSFSTLVGVRKSDLERIKNCEVGWEDYPYLRFLDEENCEDLAGYIGDFIRRLVDTWHYKGVVVGLSGGVDSTLVACLAKWAYMNDPESHVEPIKIVGLSMPTSINPTSDISDAEKIASALGIDFQLIQLDTIAKEANTVFWAAEKEELNQYQYGNMISRLRAAILNTYAAKHNLLVLGTGNKDEDYGVGYYTLFGDGAVHCSPIGNLPKRMVRIMLRWFGERFSQYIAEMSEREPTAGLEPNQTDFTDLGYSYDFVEICSMAIQYNAPALQRKMEAQFEKDFQKATRLNCVKFTNVDLAWEDFKRRHLIAVEKAKLLNPPRPNYC